MEDRSITAIIGLHNSKQLVKSSKQASLSKGRKKARLPRDKSSKRDKDKMRASSSVSETVAFDDTVKEYGLESRVVTSNASLNMNLPMLVGHEDDREYNDQERYLDLKARVKELRDENHRLSCKLRQEAEISQQLEEENRILEEELKQKCGPSGPDIICELKQKCGLEAKSPGQISRSADN